MASICGTHQDLDFGVPRVASYPCGRVYTGGQAASGTQTGSVSMESTSWCAFHIEQVSFACSLDPVRSACATGAGRPNGIVSQGKLI
jgi:hypothetical protein